MSLLNTEIQKKLLEGTYSATIVSYKEVANQKGGYIAITINTDDMEITENFFPSQLKYLGSNLRDQLGLENTNYNLAQLLEVAKEKAFNIYVTYNEYGRNIALHAPKQAPKKTDLSKVKI